MERTIEHIAGRGCRLFMHGRGGPVLYWGIARQSGEDEAVAALLSRMASHGPWTLAAYEAENWQRDFSLWPVPSLMGREEYTGGAAKTLAWLTDACVPYVEARYPADKRGARMIGGYSLSGLFSLYAFYETGLFQGAASCSGSLWYPGWAQYAQRVHAPQGSAVYLSLGAKEEKTRSRTMAAVGEQTRRQYERLQADENVRECTLVWQPGGHFTEPQRRMAQGFAWLLEHC